MDECWIFKMHKTNIYFLNPKSSLEFLQARYPTILDLILGFKKYICFRIIFVNIHSSGSECLGCIYICEVLSVLSVRTRVLDEHCSTLYECSWKITLLLNIECFHFAVCVWNCFQIFKTFIKKNTEVLQVGILLISTWKCLWWQY